MNKRLISKSDKFSNKNFTLIKAHMPVNQDNMSDTNKVKNQ